ncbi:MAG: polysaccharide deacetylase family protein [Patescibacteria group bacterium]
MKKIIAGIIVFSFISVSLFGNNAQAATKTTDLQKKTPQVESSSDPEVQRAPTQELRAQARSINIQALLAPQAITTTSLGPNLIANPGFENGSPSLPTSWQKNRWSNNLGAFMYPVTGIDGSKAASVSITSYTAGDAKWFFADVPVTAGKTYEFSNYSQASISSILTIRYKMTDGSYTYKYLSAVPAQSTFTQNKYTIIVPTNAVAMTVFHLIDKVGILSVDDYELREVITTTIPDPTPTPSENLVPNGNLESQATNGNPTGWSKNRWGNNTGSFTYPLSGVSGSKAARVTTTSYTTGDAKWYFEPVAVSAGTYEYTDTYSSTVPTELTAQFIHKDGSITYKWLGTAPVTTEFTTIKKSITVTDSVAKVTVLHVLPAVGFLTIDNVSLVKGSTPTPPPTLFSNGAVSLTFDDGWLSQYQNSVPKMNSVNMKGTFYVTSRQLSDFGFTGFFSKDTIKTIYADGHEIGSHTQTHPHLTTLSQTQQTTEIQGSRQDLLDLNVGPITTFAYPFGEYNEISIQAVKNSGYSSARSTIDGYATVGTDKYQLPRQSVEVDTSIEQIRQWIDTAIANKQWLILAFHRIDQSNDQYAVTPANFNLIIDYLAQKNARVITVDQGIKALQ